MRVLFFGTPGFAVPILRGLARSGMTVAGVVTQPSRPHGRDRKGSGTPPPPVAAAARELGLEVMQPEKPNGPEFLDHVRAIGPDAIAVAAYRHILSDRLLETAPRGGWNVHPSLLPRWRGPAPVHRTIWAGDRETGVTIIRMIRRMDAGPVAMQERTAVGDRETRGELEARLAALGARMLVQTLEAARDGKLRLSEQDEAGATHAPAFQGEDREVRWIRPAEELDRLVRALAPHPAAYFMHRGARVKVLEAAPAAGSGDPGTLLDRRPREAVLVSCGAGALWVGSVQPEGKKPMAMDAFIAGRRLKPGDSLG